MNTMMHMADGLISINIGVIFTIVSVIMMVLALRHIKQDHDDKKIPIMGVMGAFVFAAQMINFTIPATGSSGHIGGAILLCIILGQYPAFLSLCSVLIIQCLFFGDGGLLALGCNIFNIGVLPCFIAYPFFVKPILKRGINPKNVMLSSVLGVVVGLELGAFMVVVQTVISDVTALSFTTFVSLMLPLHLVIGLIEGIITTGVVLYVLKDQKDMLDNSLYNHSFQSINIKKQLLVFSILTILVGGGLSLYASNNPDGLEWSIENIVGTSEIENKDKTKEKITRAQETMTIFPDYNFSNSDGFLGTSISGLAGGALTLMVVGGIGYLLVRKKKHE
jgi:cobalt/nickel transport system permease protein